MDSTIIMNVYGFIGYSLCKSLLNSGCEVKGLVPEPCRPGTGAEEKQMEIGRNANYSETECEDWYSDKMINKSKLIIPFFDFYMLGTEKSLTENASLKSCLRRNAEYLRISLVLPCRLLFDKASRDETIMPFLEFLQNNRIVVQEIYVPTFYGQWQPEEYFFHQLIKNPETTRKELAPHEREETMDAIFLEDAMEQILPLLKMENGRFLLKSSDPNAWRDCALSLTEPDGMCKAAGVGMDWPIGIEKVKAADVLDAETVIVQKKQDYRKGLQLQQEYYEFLKKKREKA
ncbi:hypothetical protein [Mesobacillus zeae]|uniref:NAD(P)-dependent oxidoreductase n=1 Tax=Mesobacillus zeae TaxID=1917180 RepID=A0A398B2A3_9BACI|nr:hypothetical protein [Mesobacillus zeae]RID82070.1 hypothetical protein D1970_20365 [Mesobacillus zeae]